MKLLVVIAPKNFRDEELFQPEEVFHAEGIEITRASVQPGLCTGMLGGSAHAATAISREKAGSYDGLVIIGGGGSQQYLWNDAPLQDLVREFAREGKVTAAICLAPVVLAHAGILKGKRVTVFETPESVSAMRSGGANLTSAPVVRDGKVITANGPASARAFGREIVTCLKG